MKNLMILILATIFIIIGISMKVYAQEKRAFVDKRNNMVYKTVKIGNQIWMAENLDFNTNSFYAIDTKKYGYLYNWKIAKNICPDGWHLPSDDEWEQLFLEFGIKKRELKKIGWWRSPVGHKLKGTKGWGNNGGGDNSSGFNALPSRAIGFNFLKHILYNYRSRQPLAFSFP